MMSATGFSAANAAIVPRPKARAEIRLSVFLRSIAILLQMKPLRRRPLGAAYFGLIGVAARVVDGAHVIDERAGGVERAAHDLHDDYFVAEFEQTPFLAIGGAGAQCLDAAR